MRGYLVIQQPGDKEIVSGYIANFENATLQALVDQYNRAYKLGFFGVHRQALNYLALHLVFQMRFGKSPFSVKDEVLLEFTTPIHLVGEEWVSTSV